MILYYRPTCPACVAKKPTWNAYKKRHPHKALVERDTSSHEGSQRAQQHGVQYVPSLVVVQGPEERIVREMGPGDAFTEFLEAEGALIPSVKLN